MPPGGARGFGSGSRGRRTSGEKPENNRRTESATCCRATSCAGQQKKRSKPFKAARQWRRFGGDQHGVDDDFVGGDASRSSLPNWTFRVGHKFSWRRAYTGRRVNQFSRVNKRSASARRTYCPVCHWLCQRGPGKQFGSNIREGDRTYQHWQSQWHTMGESKGRMGRQDYLLRD